MLSRRFFRCLTSVTRSIRCVRKCFLYEVRSLRDASTLFCWLYMYDEDADRIIELAQQLGHDGKRQAAWMIQERSGTHRSVRRVQEIISARLGPAPTHASIERSSLVRDAIVAYMESRGLDRRYCSNCGRHGARDCAIHALAPDIDSLVFVCVAYCAVPGDF